jgi:hypothetical protein
LSINALCGVDVLPNGNFWTVTWNGEVQEFNSSGTSITEGPAGGHFESSRPCAIAIDSNENFYLVEESGGLVRKYNSAGVLQGIVDSDTSTGEPRDIVVDRSTNHLYVDHRTYVTEYGPSGEFIAKFGEAEGVNYPATASLLTSNGLAVNETTHMVYVSNNRLSSGSRHIDEFKQLPPSTIPDVTSETPAVTPTTAILKGTVDQDVANGGSKIKYCQFQWGTTASYGNLAECVPGPDLEGHVAVTAEIGGLTKGATYHFRLTAKNENGIQSNGADILFKPSGPPDVTEDIVSEVNTDSVKLSAKIDPNGGDTKYHFEFGPTTAYGTNLPAVEGEIPSGPAQTVSQLVPGLTPGATYHFRVVASNFGGKTTGVDRPFTTFALNPSEPDPCGNAQVRQQTGASLLLDCRAYELASAPNTNGYDVQSDLIPGQLTLRPEPGAADRVLYSVHFGTIPGTGEPTNLGLDPYVATRGSNGWSTSYVGINAGGPPPNPEPFGSPLSDSSSNLGTFAFGGERICNPCFADGSTGIPTRMPNGTLVQGLKGSIAAPGAEPAGYIGKSLSADGTHLVFGSKTALEADGHSGELSIYDRNLAAGVTHVVSKTTSGETMKEEGKEIGELDISSDGSRILFGHLVSTDTAGNTYWHLYMNVGDSTKSIDLTPGTTSGVLFDGMTSDGSKVFFTTPDKLVAGDTDTSADLYRADVTTSTSNLTKVSNTNNDTCNPVAGKEGPHWNNVSGAENCDVAGLAGGAGVASGDGTVFFLSPEKLDGSGTENEPNLFIARPGGSPHFVATLEPNNATVSNAVLNNEVHRFSDFQVTSSGNDAVFASSLPLTNFQNLGHSEIFRYDVPGQSLVCVSCAATGAAATGDASLASGLNVADNGAVFFTSSEALVLRDTNKKKDVYEWENGKQQLISSGISDFDSGLLSASADGVNVYFYTRATLVPQDQNGNLIKIYDARSNGGFLTFGPPPLCAASDECHGSGTQAAPPPPIGSVEGTGGNVPSQKKGKKCKKGFVKKHGKCVKKKKHKKKKRHTTRRDG